MTFVFQMFWNIWRISWLLAWNIAMMIQELLCWPRQN